MCFSYRYFLVVHLHRDYLVTTFDLSHILTNTLNNTEISFLKLLIFPWHDIKPFYAESAVNHQPTSQLTIMVVASALHYNADNFHQERCIFCSKKTCDHISDDKFN